MVGVKLVPDCVVRSSKGNLPNKQYVLFLKTPFKASFCKFLDATFFAIIGEIFAGIALQFVRALVVVPIEIVA
jgi:hypothetical protein